MGRSTPQLGCTVLYASMGQHVGWMRRVPHDRVRNLAEQGGSNTTEPLQTVVTTLTHMSHILAQSVHTAALGARGRSYREDVEIQRKSKLAIRYEG